MLKNHSLLTRLMIRLHYSTSPIKAGAIILLFMVHQLIKGNPQNTFLLATGVLGGFALQHILKLIFKMPRPENGIIKISSYSLPSGHATIAAVTFGTLIYINYPLLQSQLAKSLLISINIFLTLLIGYNRIHLKLHYIHDVISGYLLGTAWLFFTIFLTEKLFS